MALLVVADVQLQKHVHYEAVERQDIEQIFTNSVILRLTLV